MKTQINKTILDEGLDSNFARGRTYVKATLLGETFSATSLGTDKGDYSDHYAAGNKGVIGVEIATHGSYKIARQYNGRVHNENLEELGISEKDVINFLIEVVKNSFGKTRFDSSFIYGEVPWIYNYSVQESSTGYVRALEHIYYNKQLVFTHRFDITVISEP